MFANIFSLMLVTQLGLAGDVSPDQINLGKIAMPGWVQVIPQELYFTIDAPGTYKQTLEVTTFKGNGRSFDLYYRPEKISVKGYVDGGGKKGSEESRITIELTITDEEWAEFLKEKKSGTTTIDGNRKEKLQDRGIDLAQDPYLVSMLGWRITGSKTNEEELLNIPLYIKFQTEAVGKTPVIIDDNDDRQM
jgi:hypothetical protein